MSDDLFAIAEEARLKFERGIILHEVLAKLYLAYNPNVEIKSFLKQAKDNFPNGNCGLAATYIKDKLGEGELVRGSYNGQNHTFIYVKGKNRLIDITADQFGGPPVYAGVLKKPWSLMPRS